jgi:hypothetical protein
MRVNNILNSSIFRRILVIFMVGLVSRVLVNLVFDIDGYLGIILLSYYGLITCFIGYIFDMPTIGFNVFNIRLIIYAIKEYFNGEVSSGKMVLGSNTGNDNIGYKINDPKDRLFYNQDNNNDGTNNNFSSSASLDDLKGKSGEEIKGIFLNDMLRHIKKDIKSILSEQLGHFNDSDIDDIVSTIMIGGILRDPSIEDVVSRKLVRFDLSKEKTIWSLVDSIESKKIATSAIYE